MSSKTKKVKIVIIVFSITLLVFLGISLYFLLKPSLQTNKFKKTVNVNYQSKYKNNPGLVCYGNKFNCKKLKYKVKGKIDTSKLGKYKIEYTFKYKNINKKINQTVYVKDLEKPKIEIDAKTVSVCPNYKIDDIKIKVSDNYDKEIEKNIKKKFNKKNNKVIISVKDRSGNIAKKELDAVIEDKKGPIIKINGSKDKTIFVGQKYEDEGASATDNCDDNIKVETSSDLNTSVAGTYHITYSAKDLSGNTSEEKRTINVKTIENANVVYLTFDDGPSEYTNELLDILKKYNVKATFFVTGNGEDSVIKREFDEGHKIALHTFSHDYSYVYSSIDNYYNDLYAIKDRVKRITGFDSNLIRFPGGSSNTVSISYDGGIEIMSKLVNDVESKGFHYFDWNLSNDRWFSYC